MDIRIDDYEYLVKGGLYTEAINKAIIDSNGRRIVFTKNKKYKSGTIYLDNNTHLHFEDGSILEASDNIDDMSLEHVEFEDIKVNTFVNCDYSGAPKLYFIYAKDKSNIKITGNGSISGNEEIFYGEVKPTYIEGRFYPRMPLLFLENCKEIELNSITLKNSAFWTVHLVGCDTILIDSINILNNRRMLNADGIDPDHSKNIIIKNSYIESADDCIVLKGTSAFKKYGDTCNIKVSNCTLKSTSAAIKIGTETDAHFHDISFEDINILDTNRGISIQMRDSGSIENINFNNINIETHLVDPNAFWGKAEMIAITAVKRNEKTTLGSVAKISFNNIKSKSEHGVFIYGNNINDITFNNLDITLNKTTDYERDIYDLRPGQDQFKSKNSVIYTRYAKNIKLNNFKYNLDNVDASIIDSDINLI